MNAAVQRNRVVLIVGCAGESPWTWALQKRCVETFDDTHFGSLRESSIKPLPPERSGCFAEHLVAGQSDVSENVVIKLAQLST
jgi:hypothetical protein